MTSIIWLVCSMLNIFLLYKICIKSGEITLEDLIVGFIAFVAGPVITIILLAGISDSIIIFRKK